MKEDNISIKPKPQVQPNKNTNSKVTTTEDQVHGLAKQHKAPSVISSSISKHSRASVTSSHAKLQLHAAMEENQRLKSQGQPLGLIIEKQVNQLPPIITNPPERLLGPEQLGPDEQTEELLLTKHKLLE